MEFRDVAKVLDFRERKDATGNWGEIDVILSQQVIDSYDTIVWLEDDLRFNKLGGEDYVPVLKSHDVFSDPLGVFTNLRVEGEGRDARLLGTARFDLDDEVASKRYTDHKKGKVRGWSIGFRVGKYIESEDDVKEFLKENEYKGDTPAAILVGNTIMEGSSVVFPANTESVDLSKGVDDILKMEGVSTPMLVRSLIDKQRTIDAAMVKVAELEARVGKLESLPETPKKAGKGFSLKPSR